MARGETVPCKWCGKPTRMTGTKLCDPCWELDWRIAADPDIARRILEAKASDLITKEFGHIKNPAVKAALASYPQPRK